jgi:uncharacterized protein YebE (UPF0316 family)
MYLELTLDAILFALLLFSLRVFNYAISTIRLVMIGRGQRIWAATIAFMEALIFAVVIAKVVSDLSNIVNLFAYCMGAAVGSYTGMWLESRYLISYSTVTVIAPQKGQEIATRLRENNFAVTMTHGEGRDGSVDLLRSSMLTRDIPTLVRLVHEINPNAFIDVEAARNLYRGWIPGGPRGRG